MKLSRWTVLALGALIYSAVTVDNLQADSILRLSDGTRTIVIQDNGVNDLSPLEGMITFMGGIGEFVINVTTGISTPVIGSPDAPHMDIASLQITSRANNPLCPSCTGMGGTLQVAFTDTDFTQLASGNTFFRSSIGGTAGPGVTGTFSTYLDSSNTPFGMATSLGTYSFGAGAFSGYFDSSTLPTAYPYSLTEVITVSMGGGRVASFDAELQAAPEPGSLILLGSGLAGLGLLSWGRSRKRTPIA